MPHRLHQTAPAPRSPLSRCTSSRRPLRPLGADHDLPALSQRIAWRECRAWREDLDHAGSVAPRHRAPAPSELRVLRASGRAIAQRRLLQAEPRTRPTPSGVDGQSNVCISVRRTHAPDPNRKSTRPKSIDIKATVNVSLDGLAALTTTRAPPQKRAAGSAAPVYASMHTTTVSGSTPS